ncbi:MAG TPA: ABC transporter ATP-binding protein [Pseudonocardia sp.]
MTSAPSVVFDEITTIIDDEVILHRLSFEVPAGEVTVLMGPSGAGKTTLIGHLVGLKEPDGGTITVAGRDIWEFTRDEWRKFRQSVGAMIGGSYQVHTSTFGSLSIVENLVYTLGVLGVPDGDRQPRALERLRELDLAADANLLPAELPAHAVKRAALARALVTDAPLIILDEIDLGLDVQHSEKMIDALRGLRSRADCTILLTTHSIDLAKTIADKVAILSHGRIVAYGPPGNVLAGVNTAEDFRQVFEFQRSAPPLTVADVEGNLDRRARQEPTEVRKSADPAMIKLAIVLLILVVATLLALHAGLI